MNPEVLKQRVESAPQNALFRFSYGQALFQSEQYEAAIPQLEFCCASRDDWMLPRILLGKALLQTRGMESARPWLENALQLAIEQHHEGPEAEVRGLLAE